MGSLVLKSRLPELYARFTALIKLTEEFK